MARLARPVGLRDLNWTLVEKRRLQAAVAGESPPQLRYAFEISHQSFAEPRIAARFCVKAERGMTWLQPAACALAARSTCTCERNPMTCRSFCAARTRSMAA